MQIRVFRNFIHIIRQSKLKHCLRFIIVIQSGFDGMAQEPIPVKDFTSRTVCAARSRI